MTSSDPKQQDSVEPKSDGVENGAPETVASESDAPSPEAASCEDEAAAALLRSAELEAQNEQLKDQLLRLQADFENHRKRSFQQQQNALHYGHEALARDLLGTLDNLERAAIHAAQSGPRKFKALQQGVELLQRELHAVLERHGIQMIDAEGAPFDPKLHEAMAQVEDTSRAPGLVIEVLQKGYRLREHLLRPARVTVSKAPSPPPEAPETAEAEDEPAPPKGF